MIFFSVISANDIRFGLLTPFTNDPLFPLIYPGPAAIIFIYPSTLQFACGALCVINDNSSMKGKTENKIFKGQRSTEGRHWPCSDSMDRASVTDYMRCAV